MQDLNGPTPAEKEAALTRAVERMGPPRIYVLGPDGTLTKRDTL